MCILCAFYTPLSNRWIFAMVLVLICRNDTIYSNVESKHFGFLAKRWTNSKPFEEPSRNVRAVQMCTWDFWKTRLIQMVWNWLFFLSYSIKGAYVLIYWVIRNNCSVVYYAITGNEDDSLKQWFQLSLVYLYT